jgi:hypothetical protein
VHPYRLVDGHQCVTVHAGATDVDDAPHAYPLGLFEQRFSGADVNAAELPLIDSADVRRVQSGSLDHDVRPPKCGLTHLEISQIAHDAGPFAGCTTGPANRPATIIKRRRDSRTYTARSSSDSRNADR